MTWKTSLWGEKMIIHDGKWGKIDDRETSQIYPFN